MTEFTINVVQDPSTVIDISSLDQAVFLDISQNQANLITIEDDVNNVLLNASTVDLSNYATIPYTTGISGILQTQISSLNSQTGSYVTGQVVRPSETGQFYPTSNPSGYISIAEASGSFIPLINPVITSGTLDGAVTFNATTYNFSSPESKDSLKLALEAIPNNAENIIALHLFS
jgi:hypothetical protein